MAQQRALRGNLAGKQVGRLLVLRRVKNKKKDGAFLYRCKCDCGTGCTIRANCLQMKTTKSCGCLRKDLFSPLHRRDEAGNRYGQLTVIKYGGKTRRGQRRWLCQCDCGEQTIVTQMGLIHGRTRSCGCLNRLELVPVGR